MNWFFYAVIELLSLLNRSIILLTSSTSHWANWHSSNFPMIKWLRTSGTITAANPAGINLFRWSYSEIASNSLHVTRYTLSLKRRRRKIMKRSYYSNEVLFLLWTEELFFSISSRPPAHSSKPSFSMSHVYKRHKIWMSFFYSYDGDDIGWDR